MKIKKQDERKRALVAVSKYMRILADLMGLRDWELRLSWDAAEEGNMAEIMITQDRHIATIYLAENFTTWTREETRNTFAHELAHIFLDAPERVVDDAAGALGETAFALLKKQHHRQIEIATDALAGALVRGLPLPAK